MIRVGVLGAAGRMGRRLTTLLLTRTFPKLVLERAFIAPHNALIGQKLTPLHPAMYEVLSLESLSNVDVLIDFSESYATLQTIPLIKELKKPLIIGTTGFSEVQKEEIKKLSELVPLVLAPNTSLGVNVLIQLIEHAATLLPQDFDVSIIETHHKDKKDSPSGTALKLKDHLERVKPGLSVPVQSIRGGDVIGEHTVLFLGAGEQIELTHLATSRDIFAKGALKAALWITDQKPGLYTMQDVLRGSLS